MSINGVDLKDISLWDAPDGIGMRAIVTLDGNPIARFYDAGTGGSGDLDFSHGLDPGKMPDGSDAFHRAVAGRIEAFSGRREQYYAAQAPTNLLACGQNNGDFIYELLRLYEYGQYYACNSMIEAGEFIAELYGVWDDAG